MEAKIPRRKCVEVKNPKKAKSDQVSRLNVLPSRRGGFLSTTKQ